MLEFDRLRVCYGDFPAVSSFSWQIGEGQIAALIGVNGAGKTTLLQAAAGLIPPRSGHIRFCGEDITALSADEVIRRGLCLVPQGGRCFLRMSVQDNLLTGSYRRAARPYARQSLEEVYALFPDLKRQRRRPAGTLSGGQRQMLAIGRALMARPRCLLFDEISLGLAPVVIQSLYECIGRINRERGITVVLVEQDIRRVLRIADLCAVMLQGRSTLSGRVEQMAYRDIRDAYFGLQRGANGTDSAFD